jgi:hypothetical protein
MPEITFELDDQYFEAFTAAAEMVVRPVENLAQFLAVQHVWQVQQALQAGQIPFEPAEVPGNDDPPAETDTGPANTAQALPPDCGSYSEGYPLDPPVGT